MTSLPLESRNLRKDCSSLRRQPAPHPPRLVFALRPRQTRNQAILVRWLRTNLARPPSCPEQRCLCASSWSSASSGVAVRFQECRTAARLSCVQLQLSPRPHRLGARGSAPRVAGTIPRVQQRYSPQRILFSYGADLLSRVRLKFTAPPRHPEVAALALSRHFPCALGATDHTRLFEIPSRPARRHGAPGTLIVPSVLRQVQVVRSPPEPTLILPNRMIQGARGDVWDISSQTGYNVQQYCRRSNSRGTFTRSVFHESKNHPVGLNDLIGTDQHPEVSQTDTRCLSRNRTYRLVEITVGDWWDILKVLNALLP